MFLNEHQQTTTVLGRVRSAYFEPKTQVQTDVLVKLVDMLSLKSIFFYVKIK